MEVEYVLNIPEGHMRFDYGLNRLNGEFAVIFSSAPEYREPGEYMNGELKDEVRRPKLALVVNTPERAEMLAEVFRRTAQMLKAQGVKQ